MVTGPDGRVWITESSNVANKIAAIASNGDITEYQIPTASAGAQGIVVGPDNNLWVSLTSANKIARVTPQGIFTEFGLPTPNSQPFGLASGPDGNIWVALSNVNKIARVTLSGEVTEFSIPTENSLPIEIVSGSDGALWFTESNVNAIGRLTTAGTFSEFVLPTADSVPQALILGPDNNVWFTELVGNKIGKITPAGAITEYELPTPFSFPYDIARGANGLLWFVETLGNKIGSITSIGVITEYELPAKSTVAVGIATTANEDVWFVGTGSGAVGRMTTVIPGLHFGPVFSSAQPTSRSFLRFYNTSSSVSSAVVQFANASTGAFLGEWSTGNLPAGAEMQFDVAGIEQSINLSGELPQFYTVTVTSNFTGYAQHVLWRSADGTLTNLSTCNSGHVTERIQLMGVHSTLLANGYPSSISISNPSTTAFFATLGIYDARDGTKLGSFTSPAIQARAQIVIPVSEIEDELGLAPSGNLYHYVVKAEGRFPGFLQHLVTNQQSGVVTDMTAMCALNP